MASVRRNHRDVGNYEVCHSAVSEEPEKGKISQLSGGLPAVPSDTCIGAEATLRLPAHQDLPRVFPVLTQTVADPSNLFSPGQLVIL